MRCPDCNKMVSYDGDTEPEVQDETIEATRVVLEVRQVLNCSECGTELRGRDVTIIAPFTISSRGDGVCTTEDAHGWEVEDISLEATTVLKGKKTLYGIEGTVSLKCDNCGGEAVASVSEDPVPATEMEESV